MIDKLGQLNYYELYVNDMFSYGISFGIKKEHLMDLIHDVFLSFYEKHQDILPEEVKFYLLLSLKNRIISVWRDENKHTDLSIDEYEFCLEVDNSMDIEEKEDQAIYRKCVSEILKSLTAKQREAI